MIVFMGVAGSGKSVQGKLLADDLSYRWLSTGEFLRMHVTGQRRKEMLAGKLLKDEEIIDMLAKYFNETDTNGAFVLDGFPRTLPQAKWLLEQHTSGKIHVDGVVHLRASRDIVKKRLLSRGRQDDTEEAINQRFQEYEELTLPIVSWFQENEISIYDIDGETAIDEIHKDIMRKLQKG